MFEILLEPYLIYLSSHVFKFRLIIITSYFGI